MPLKRVTPSFTVEYRQAKRPNTGSAKLGWARAQPAPEVAEKGSRVAISAFKTAAGHSPAEAISPSIPRGRILPSLETLPVTGQADAERAQSRSEGSAAKADHATQLPRDGTVARQLGENIYSAEDLEPLVAVGATTPRLERPTSSDLSASKTRTPRSEKQIRHPAEKHAKLDHDSNASADTSNASADTSETAPMGSTSGLAPVDEPLSTTRTSRILDRYVFRAERGPGESWKRRIEARRERRA
jgi:hypothetical protein